MQRMAELMAGAAAVAVGLCVLWARRAKEGRGEAEDLAGQEDLPEPPGEAPEALLGFKPPMGRVLVVEDEPRRVQAMKVAGLVPEGATVVNRALEGVAAVEAGPWEMVWLDFDLVGREKGDEVASALARAPWRPERVCIHSTNTEGGLRMSYILRAAGLVPAWVPITKLLPGQGLD